MPEYSLTSVNVGDATRSTMPRPRATPCTNVVFPAPRSPVSTTTSRARSIGASASPTSRVSSAEPVRTSTRIVRRAPAGRGRPVARRCRSRSPPATPRPLAGRRAFDARGRSRPAAARTASISRRHRAGSPRDGTSGSRSDRATSCTWPRSRVMPACVFSTNRVAKLPRVTITRGWIREICSTSHGVHASISSGRGSRFPGGRHFTMLAMYTRSRVRPISPSMRVSSCPAAPTNGSPCLSSWKPGPSPMNIRSASGSPTPKTTWVRP